MAVRDRATGTRIDEPVPHAGWLRALYAPGPWLVALFGPWFSVMVGVAARSRWSRAQVGRFAQAQAVDPATLDRPLSDYPTLDALFTRPVPMAARPIDADPSTVICPCDGALSAWSLVRARDPIPVKGGSPSLAEIVGDPSLAAHLDGAAVALVRLRPGDLHRVVSPLAGRVGPPRRIPGPLHSVHPLSGQSGLKNQRAVLPIGPDTAVIPIGALHVGSLEVLAGATQKGDEIAVFHLGGSAVLVVGRAITWDPDLLAATRDGDEVRVRLGERIGQKMGAGDTPPEPEPTPETPPPGLWTSLDLANLVTLASLGLAFVAMIASLEGQLRLAFVLVGTTSVLDAVDGWLARRLGSADGPARQLGVHLDNLVDVVAFGVAPAVVLYQAGLSGWMGAGILATLPLAAALRLAWFAAHGRRDRFRGVPSTTSGVLAPVVGLVGLVDPSGFRLAAGALALTLAAGMVSPVEVPRPGPLARGLLAALALATVTAWLTLPGRLP